MTKTAVRFLRADFLAGGALSSVEAPRPGTSDPLWMAGRNSKLQPQAGASMTASMSQSGTALIELHILQVVLGRYIKTW